MNDLQALGMELTKLSTDTLKKIGLDEDLYEAVVTYKKITSNGALKRQSQFIGRLMRDTDPAPIEAFLAKLRGENTAHNAFLQRVEQARTRLLADDNALTQFMADFPHADTGKLRTLIRNTKKEQEQNKPPKNTATSKSTSGAAATIPCLRCSTRKTRSPRTTTAAMPTCLAMSYLMAKTSKLPSSASCLSGKTKSLRPS